MVLTGAFEDVEIKFNYFHTFFVQIIIFFKIYCSYCEMSSDFTINYNNHNN